MENKDANMVKDAVVEFFLSSPELSEPLLREVVQKDSLNVDLLRARISPADAWLRLQLTGTADSIDAFIRRHRDKFLVLYPAAEAAA
jgi:hypothetical protein